MQLTPEKAWKFSEDELTEPKIYSRWGNAKIKIPINSSKFNPTNPNNIYYFPILSVIFDSESANSSGGHCLPKDNLGSLICWSGDLW